MLVNTLMVAEQKFIIFRGEVVTLTKSSTDGLWRSDDGCIFALTDDSASVDKSNNCGVGIFSLPDGNPLNELCAVHDYEHSSPAFQLFHTRLEADNHLEYLISAYGGAWSFLARPFYWICRVFGGKYWENPKTR